MLCEKFVAHIETAHVNFYPHLEFILLTGSDLIHQVEIGP